MVCFKDIISKVPGGSNIFQGSNSSNGGPIAKLYGHLLNLQLSVCVCCVCVWGRGFRTLCHPL